jgi:FkbM family methyltransferase
MLSSPNADILPSDSGFPIERSHDGLTIDGEESVARLLTEGIEGCQDREAEAFDLAATGAEGIVLFGAGGLGRKTLATLRSDGKEPLAFVDNNGSLWGTKIEGIPVLSPAEAAILFGNSAAFVVTIWAAWADSMRDQIASLQRLGCRTVIPFSLLAWKYRTKMLPHIQIDLPSRVHEHREDVLRCAQLWSDEDSLEDYINQLRWRLFSDFDALGPPQTTQYWQPDLMALGDDTVFVDVGAFDGDTIAEFIALTKGRFRSVDAFEPDPHNFQALQRRISLLPEGLRHKIKIHQQAVGNYDGLIPFTTDAGEGSKVGGKETVHCVTLDGALGGHPSFIKYDVEGFEPAALSGSCGLISKWHPSLAVCVYHVQDHLWRLPLQIHAMNPRYNLYLRSHGQVWETVCYAIPQRVKV